MAHITARKPNVIALLLREIADSYRFFREIPKTEKMIVFYAEHKGYYPNFEGLIEELIGKYEQTLCYITSDPNDPILQTSELRIRTFYLNKLLPFFMVFINCKVFVMTLTDLNQSYLKRSINPVHYVYVFHALVSTHMMYRYGAFDHYDAILCVGPHHVREIRKCEELNSLPPKRLVEAGYYRLERIYREYQKYSRKESSSGDKRTVLIAPSWGTDNVLESCGERLADILLKAGYEVIVRPHPETGRRSPELMTLFDSKFGRNPNFTLERSVATDDSLLRADVLICDCSGIALEYAFGTERPVLFLDVPIKIQNRRFEELGIEPLELLLRSEIGVIVSRERLGTVPGVISNLVANSGAYRKRIVELRDQNVYAFGRSSEIGAQYIIDLVNE